MEYVWHPINSVEDLPKGLQEYWWTYRGEPKVVKHFNWTGSLYSRQYLQNYSAWAEVLPNPEPYKEQ